MPRTQRTVMVAYFLLFLGGGVWMPYFPLYLSHLGYSGWEIGIIFGLQPALRWVSALGWAYAADRWRVRHRLLVSAALSGGLCFIPLLFVRSFAPMALVTGMIAVLHAPLIPMTDSTVMDHLAGLGGDYGRLRLWGSVAFVLGALGSAPIVRPAVAAGAAAEQHWRPDTVRPGRIGIGGSIGVAVAGLVVDRLGTAGLFGCETGVALFGLLPALRLRRLVPD